MELTVTILRQWFTAFNERYFSGELPQPRLQVSRARTLMGQFRCRRERRGLLFGRYVTTGYTIAVSEFYDLDAHDYQQTLLHEMIHFWLAYRGLRDTSAHGPLFRREMERINREGGWHITVSERRRALPVRQAPQAGRQYLLLALATTDGRHFLTVVNPAYRRVLDRQATHSPLVAAHHWLVSTDTRYATWSRARSLRGRRISADDYLRLCATRSEE